ncbi:MAG: 3'-5' exonuclease [Candidatus Omnitrophica bacterium]|nr:3'-5' exonuclease [bacterium]MBU1864448.1 3'-5' exonuclease [Candidatus Omnitrophota bacterium]
MIISRPLVLVDLETTGTWIEKDKIIEIGMIKCLPDGTMNKYLKRINPGIPIPPEITELTGITNEDVKDAPLFKDIAEEILLFIEDADLGGFNAKRFDLPLLKRELYESEIIFEWESRVIFDAQIIYHVFEKRDLTAAYEFYCQKNMANAHSALGDVEATLEVLEKQVEKYGIGSGHLDDLKDVDYQKKDNFYDNERKFCWWNGELYLLFGKYAKKKSLKKTAEEDPNYLRWILKADFSNDVKLLVKNALEGQFPQKEYKIGK